MYELTQALNDELDFAAARNFHLLVQNEKKNWRLCWDAVTCTLESLMAAETPKHGGRPKGTERRISIRSFQGRTSNPV